MVEIVLETVATVIMMLGVILIYDAREISKKMFSFGDQNEATKTMKVLGFIIAVIAGIIIISIIR